VILDLGANRIRFIPDMQTNVALEDLWLNDNQITSFEDLQYLVHNKKLQTLYLERNPVST
jgi:protein phosphatase 1 regulatory subunit 7